MIGRKFLFSLLVMTLTLGYSNIVAAQETISECLGATDISVTEDITVSADLAASLDVAVTSYVALDESAAELGLANPAPGVAVLVITPDGRYFKAFGVADIETCAPLEPTAQFQIGSNTKMMTSAIIYQLQEKGVLSTNDLVSEWLPDETALLPFGDQLTVEMLLTHTSGVYDYLNGVNEDGYGYQAVTDSAALERSFTPAELVQYSAAEGQPYFEPGAARQWEYSNTGYIMLGQIIEATTGMTLAENYGSRIWEPLDMADTYLGVGIPDGAALPQGYFRYPFDVNTTRWNMNQAWSAGAVVSTAEDMAVFVKALYSGDLFAGAATLDLMTTPAVAGYSQFSNVFYYGHGMFYKFGFLGHGGQTLGFQSDVGYKPDVDVTIVIWGNSAENELSNAVMRIGNAAGYIPSEDISAWADAMLAAAPETDQAESAETDMNDTILIDTEWRWQEFQSMDDTTVTVPNPENFLLTFDADGGINLRVDCNNAGGSYMLAGSSLTIEIGVMTRVACPPDSLDRDYLRYLGDVRSYVIEDGELFLSLMMDGGMMRFTSER